MPEAPQAPVPQARSAEPHDTLAQFSASRHELGARVEAPVFALVVIAAGIGAMTLASLTSDQHVAAGFDRAVASPSARTVVTASEPQRTAPPVSGTEAFWLDTASSSSSSSRTMPLSRATWTGRAITPGDRFAFAGAAGRRILEVTEVRQLDAAQAATGAADHPATPMLLVTLRDTAGADAVPLRLLLDAQAPLANLTPLGDTPDRDL